MAISFYPNGIGGSLGANLAFVKPLSLSGNIWFVHFGTGTDAASPAGQNREKPLKTLAQAYTNAANDDIIVFLDGHAETLTAMQTINKRLTLVGEGSNAGVPTVKFTNNQAAALMWSIISTNVQVCNIKFPENAQVAGNAKVQIGSTSCVFESCYFECGANDASECSLLVALNSNNCTLTNNTFVSTATLTTAQPESALKSGGALANLTMIGNVVSAGTVGFSRYYAIDFSAGAVSQLYCTNQSLLLGADMKLHASTTGYVNIQTATGNSKVLW